MQSIYDQIWESALRSIQARMVSKQELSRKLLAKYPSEDYTVSKVLEEMERVMLLDDKRYTEQLLHHLTQKPIGRIKIMVEARRRGLDEELVESLLIASGYDEAEAARRALNEKETRVKETDPRKRKFKLMNFLRNRGFTDSTIYKALRTQGAELI